MGEHTSLSLTFKAYWKGITESLSAAGWDICPMQNLELYYFSVITYWYGFNIFPDIIPIILTYSYW